MMNDAHDILTHPVTTEKAVRLMESENKLTFVVKKNATKDEIKKAIEGEFSVKVAKVSTLILPSGRKKAYIRLTAEHPAMDVATKLGLL